MIIDLTKLRLFVQPGATDMRKQINGLALLVEEEIDHDIFGDTMFLFCNKARNRLKILYWDRNGFCLWLKRLEKDKFPWPMKEEDVLEITSDKLVMLLSGIDFFHAHKKLHFSSTI